jgi:hypothetical protein
MRVSGQSHGPAGWAPELVWAQRLADKLRLLATEFSPFQFQFIIHNHPTCHRLCRPAKWPRGLSCGSWPLKYWDRGFESSSRHECLSSSFCIVLTWHRICRPAKWPRGLSCGSWPLKYWDRGFESSSRHECLSSSFCIVLSCRGRDLTLCWSPVQEFLPNIKLIHKFISNSELEQATRPNYYSYSW